MPIENNRFRELDDKLQGIIITTCKATMEKGSRRKINAYTLYRIFNLGNPAINFVMQGEKVASWNVADESKEVMKLLIKNYL